MIRINLLTSRPQAAMGAGSFDDLVGAGDTLDQRVIPIIIFKLLIIFSGSLILYYWEEELQLPEKRAQLNQKQQELQQIQTKNNSSAEIVNQTKKYEEMEVKLLEQIQAVESLRGDALREVKFLDKIQKEMPDRMWLTKVEQMGDSEVIAEGIAQGDSEVNNFIDALSKSPVLREVRLNFTQEKVLEGISLKEFKITCLFPKYEVRRENKVGENKSEGAQVKPDAVPASGATHDK